MPHVESGFAEASQSNEAPSIRVLVVDDNLDVADAIGCYLRFSGFDVCVAYSGAGALAQGNAIPLDAAIIDLGMPHMNGFALVRLIRAQPWGGHMLLVAMTGWCQANDERAAIHAGFDLFMRKPVDTDSIEREIRSFAALRPRGDDSRLSPIAMPPAGVTMVTEA